MLFQNSLHSCRWFLNVKDYRRTTCIIFRERCYAVSSIDCIEKKNNKKKRTYIYMPLSMFYKDFLYDISLQIVKWEYFVNFNSEFNYFSIWTFKSITQNCTMYFNYNAYSSGYRKLSMSHFNSNLNTPQIKVIQMWELSVGQWLFCKDFFAQLSWWHLRKVGEGLGPPASSSLPLSGW